ncbi:MAG TPA: HAD-IA family hydrolase [Rhodothermales bacterium]|nr:HAD-IA family hydrolase [Rhodothermales bacterium]
MNPDTIRFIYFDLDDTLLDHRHAEREGLADVCRQFDRHFGHLPLEKVQAIYHEQNVPLWQKYAAGKLDKDDLKRLRFEQTLEALSVEGLEAETLNNCYLDCYANHWLFPDDARNAFHALSDRFPVGILTNGFSEVQDAKLDCFPTLRERAKAIVISETVGYMKPHPRLFAHATDLAGVPADAILYIGDSYSSDVQGATQAGWQMAWYTAQEDEIDEIDEPVFRFQQWGDLLENLIG